MTQVRADDVLGQEGALAVLDRMRSNGKIPHGLLFQGPEGTGKATVAGLFAAQLLCEGTDGAPCGRCESCRLVESGGHPDLLTVHRLPRKPSGARDGAESGDLRQFVLVDQIRELTRIAGMAPRRGRRRVFVIDPADRMNVEAQNALLKTLEEPPGRAVILLIASRPHLLLPTVRSRCFVVGFAAMRIPQLASALERRGVDPHEALTRAALAEGRPGRALGLDLERLRRRRDEVLASLETLAQAEPSAVAELPRLASDLAGKTEDELTESLDLLEALLRDAARAGRGSDDAGRVHADLGPRLDSLGQSLGPRRAAELVRCVELLRRDLRFNVNRTLIAESLLAAVAGGPLPDA